MTMRFPHKPIAVVVAVAAAAAASVAAVAHWMPHAVPQESALMYDGLPFYTQNDLLPRWHGAGGRRIGTFTLRDQYGAKFDEQIFDHGPTVVKLLF